MLLFSSVGDNIFYCCSLHLYEVFFISSWPCNSVALWKDVIVGGFASGHLRVYSAASGAIGAEVTAHARAVNAVDIAKESGLVSGCTRNLRPELFVWS